MGGGLYYFRYITEDGSQGGNTFSKKKKNLSKPCIISAWRFVSQPPSWYFLNWESLTNHGYAWFILTKKKSHQCDSVLF